MALTRKSGAKDKILRQHSALNPRPDGIKDKLFADYEFFDSHDTAQVKYEMLRRVQKDGWSVSRAAKTFGFSRNAFYQARIAFQQAGIWGLFRARPGPRRAHKFTQEVMDFIEKSIEDNSSLSTLDLRQLLQERFGISVHRRSIERAQNRQQKKG
ncbi:MAG: helix-turn-helix domain-containing protein [Gammaproteobacteria bacterium]